MATADWQDTRRRRVRRFQSRRGTLGYPSVLRALKKIPHFTRLLRRVRYRPQLRPRFNKSSILQAVILLPLVFLSLMVLIVASFTNH